MSTRKVYFCDRRACGAQIADGAECSIKIFSARKSDGVEMVNHYRHADLCPDCTRFALRSLIDRIAKQDNDLLLDWLKDLKTKEATP
jgi:hypothetical protein